MIFSMAVAFVLVYYVYKGMVYNTVFSTFSISILLIYLLDILKEYAFKKPNAVRISLSVLTFSAAVFAAYLLCDFITVDYGFFGVLVPVFISLFDFSRVSTGKLERLDNFYVRVAMLALGLYLLAAYGVRSNAQYFALLSVPLVLLYNGKIGLSKMKYAFYIFYPLHLVLLEGIHYLIYGY